MAGFLWLAYGVCCALLCHWMIRHTYSDYEWEGYGCPRKKVWTKKLQFPRWTYILLWLFCIGLLPLAILAPIILAFTIAIRHSEGEWRFQCENKFVNWLTKKV